MGTDNLVSLCLRGHPNSAAVKTCRVSLQRLQVVTRILFIGAVRNLNPSVIPVSLIEAFKRRRRKFVKVAGGAALRKLEDMIAGASIYGRPPVFNTDDFPWAAELEANWEVIRREAEHIVALRDQIPNFQDISKDQKSITNDDKWKTFFFYGMTHKAEKNCQRCPETTRLLENIPGMTTAFFSILLPGKEIKAHRGLFNGFVRYHLGLIIPDPADQCGIRIDDQVYHWKEGKSLIFDDTYDHAAWNRTDGIRVVLFLDIVRPMRQPVAAITNLIVKIVAQTGYIKDGQKNQQYWDEQLKDVPLPSATEVAQDAHPVAVH